MKKTLVALAVLAVSGASFAQVTITGSVAMGYKAATIVNPASTARGYVSNALLGGADGYTSFGDSSGLGVDTTTVTFAASEDLGGGMSIAASMNIDSLTRAGATGGDASLKLTTPVGRLTLQTYKNTDYLSGGLSGVGGVGLDDKVFGKRSLYDQIGFDTKVGPVYVGVSQSEQGTVTNAPAAGTAAALGLGAGASGAASAVGQRNISIALTYVDGPLIAGVNYLSYDNRTSTAVADGVSQKDVVRGQLSYDLGVAKLGAGYSVGTQVAGNTISDAFVAVSVPMGALTLGANYGTRTTKDVPAVFTGFYSGQLAAAGYGAGSLPTGSLDATRSGYSLAANYALSKRTSVSLSYVNWLAFSDAANRNSETAVLLAHSF